MKDFDIEKLERKNCFKTPEHFFEDMQRNVFEKVKVERSEITAPPTIKRARIVSLKWFYNAAACVVFAIGLYFASYLFNDAIEKQPVVAMTDTAYVPTPKKDTAPTKEQKEYYAFVEGVQEVNQTEGNHRVEKVHTKSNKKSYATNSVKNVQVSFSEAKVDQFLESLPQEEAYMLTQNSDKDIYLDLYY